MSVASGSERETEMSKYGVTLLYINAGMMIQCNESEDNVLLQRTMRSLQNRVPENLNTEAETALINLLFLFQRAMMLSSGAIIFPRSYGL